MALQWFRDMTLGVQGNYPLTTENQMEKRMEKKQWGSVVFGG